MKIDLDHVFLLGWHSENGMRNLTNWNGRHLWINVVVVGANDVDMSYIMWSSPLHRDFQLLLVPPLTNNLFYARSNGGLHAFGWYFDQGIKRPPRRPIVDPWQWYNDILLSKEEYGKL